MVLPRLVMPVISGLACACVSSGMNRWMHTFMWNHFLVFIRVLDVSVCVCVGVSVCQFTCRCVHLYRGRCVHQASPPRAWMPARVRVYWWLSSPSLDWSWPTPETAGRRVITGEISSKNDRCWHPVHKTSINTHMVYAYTLTDTWYKSTRETHHHFRAVLLPSDQDHVLQITVDHKVY